MESAQIAQRLLIAYSRIIGERMRAGASSTDIGAIRAAAADLCKASIWVDDQFDLDAGDCRRRAEQLRQTVGDLGLVVLDYFQLLHRETTGELFVRAEQARFAELKRIARSVECPVLVVSQVDRVVVSMSNKRPQPRHVRGSVEMADAVLTLYRDEVYNPETVEPGVAELGIYKGLVQVGEARLGFDSDLMTFHDIDP